MKPWVTPLIGLLTGRIDQVLNGYLKRITIWWNERKRYEEDFYS